jgi:hypothetical protein
VYLLFTFNFADYFFLQKKPIHRQTCLLLPMRMLLATKFNEATSAIYAVVTVGPDVYLAGNTSAGATYWKNGIETDITEQAGAGL